MVCIILLNDFQVTFRTNMCIHMLLPSDDLWTPCICQRQLALDPCAVSLELISAELWTQLHEGNTRHSLPTQTVALCLLLWNNKIKKLKRIPVRPHWDLKYVKTLSYSIKQTRPPLLFFLFYPAGTIILIINIQISTTTNCLHIIW